MILLNMLNVMPYYQVYDVCHFLKTIFAMHVSKIMNHAILIITILSGRFNDIMLYSFYILQTYLIILFRKRCLRYERRKRSELAGITS